jgi:hypothetical protein
MYYSYISNSHCYIIITYMYTLVGGITIKKPMKESLVEIKAWAATHRGELVLMYLSHFDGDDSCNTQVTNHLCLVIQCVFLFLLKILLITYSFIM